MIAFRDRLARGHFRRGWLESFHTFSFGAYHDPAQMGFRTLRVINEDRVIPGAGFPAHGHSDMEILTYVLAGALEHKDSLGTGSVVRAGDVQRMSAGTGVRHSEYNASDAEPAHLLQIWILPARSGAAPGYEQKSFPAAERRNELILAAAPGGEAGAVTLHQDARLYLARLDAGRSVAHSLAPGRGAWLQVARGLVALNETEMREGDGAAATEEPRLAVEALTDAEILLFDLA
jgi:redox-sensitive bicupin YhaK (pirin superfamily)